MIALYAGSFDPVTLGHIDIITRGAHLATRLIVAVADNPHKMPLFSVQERIALLRDALHGIEVEITAFSGLLAEYARQRNVTAILRGLRDGDDFASERRYAWHNQLFDGNIETIFLPASPALSMVSSRMVREAAQLIVRAGLNDSALDALVPPNVCTALREKFIAKG
ncbi:MAG: pantetheine-phosphate adenylyltransferase [Defluviitaleaceae bacterium]|nr:pantetheine-phosphate adenylyltransferase [Defluviitaleaceae bacterium]MCL2275045.1 pantetheine-phosphate adenylyltransferase [Defluviitaleaceae bacterium]